VHWLWLSPRHRRSCYSGKVWHGGRSVVSATAILGVLWLLGTVGERAGLSRGPVITTPLVSAISRIPMCSALTPSTSATANLGSGP